MILPAKDSLPGASLLEIDARILAALRSPLTVSDLWAQIRPDPKQRSDESVTYGRFVLALDLLYLIGVVDFRDGALIRTSSTGAARPA